jgi:hypothetical protein
MSVFLEPGIFHRYEATTEPVPLVVDVSRSEIKKVADHVLQALAKHARARVGR